MNNNLAMTEHGISSRQVVQSYIVTTAMYDFNVFEKRVLYNLVIDDETVIYSKDISFKLNRPFMTDDTGKPKYFTVC